MLTSREDRKRRHCQDIAKNLFKGKILFSILRVTGVCQKLPGGSAASISAAILLGLPPEWFNFVLGSEIARRIRQKRITQSKTRCKEDQTPASNYSAHSEGPDKPIHGEGKFHSVEAADRCVRCVLKASRRVLVLRRPACVQVFVLLVWSQWEMCQACS